MWNFILSIPLSLAIIFAPGLFQTITNSGFMYCPDGCSIVSGGNNRPLQLVNNASAVNPTFDELMAFLKADDTDMLPFVTGGPQAFICSDFAKRLHDNAEACGIRAGFVNIAFNGKHLNYTINVFETSDAGLVFIDCTGQFKKSWDGSRYTGEDNVGNTGEIHSSDTLAYLAKGEEYGRISTGCALSAAYAFYTEYNSKRALFNALVDEYNSQVSLFNAAVAGKAFSEDSSQLSAIKEWQNEIAALADKISSLQPEIDGYCYASPGVVSDFVIYW
jgi:hypothetical protein